MSYGRHAGVMMDAVSVKKLILGGERLILAGDEDVLCRLPAGSWIGGTIPYFMTQAGGLFSRESVYVTRVPEFVKELTAKVYDVKNIHQLYQDAPANGFSIIILPAFSAIHTSFALKSPSYEGFKATPLIGWVAGVALDDLGRIPPRVFDGKTSYMDEAVVFHLELPAEKSAELNVINIFEPADGDVVNFPTDGFQISTAYVNGHRVDFNTYLKENLIDTELPLIGQVDGTYINTSIRKLNDDTRRVEFYAPVFAGIDYRMAKPVPDYIAAFAQNLPRITEDEVFFNCNCILNYIYGGLEKKVLQGFTGPMTFGEVVYQLQNQTMAYLVIK